MPRNFFRTVLLTLCLAAGLSPSDLAAQTAYATTITGQLLRFSVATPGTIAASMTITGLQGSEVILGIDFRPAGGQLLALGSTSRLYTINTTTGAATQVGTSGAFTLNGSMFGFDVNPLADRIRVVSDLDQNIRLNPTTGALVAADTALTYAVGDVNAGANPNVVGSAYTNNFAGATTTVLYGIDSNLDVLVKQDPPNSGILNTVGLLGVGASAVLAFDIVSSAGVDTGYAAMPLGGTSALYRINLTTGAATLLGSFPAATAITGLAVVSDPPRLANISTRGQVRTGNEVMIAGFVIGGPISKNVAIVVTGPSLAAFGISNPLANPTLTLVRSSDQAVLASIDNWQDAPNAAQLQAAGFAPSNALEAALLVNLPPGAYTAVVQGAGGGTGVAVAAVYEVGGPEIPLSNISTRGMVLTGNDVMIGGFVIQGHSPQQVAIVATGPSLAAFGISNPLANPTLTLVRSSDQTVLASIDNWQDAPNAAQLQAAGFAPSNALEAAILATLPPGAYTAVVQGVSGGTGVAVVGVYRVP